MNDTLANITKTFLGNADEDLEFFLPASPLSPPAVLPWPPPLLKHKDGKQNFQESENLIYLKGKKEKPSCVPASQPPLPRRKYAS